MKKVCLFLIFSLLVFSISSFKSERTFDDPDTNCDYLAMSEYFLILGSGQDQETANNAFFDVIGIA